MSASGLKPDIPPLSRKVAEVPIQHGREERILLQLHTARFVPLRYPLLLGTFTFLFILRVSGQVLVGIHEVSFLPPFEHWYSGLLPYPLLLLGQIALIVLMLKIVRDFARGDGYFVDLRPHTGTSLKVLSCVYFLSMIVRYVVTMVLH